MKNHAPNTSATNADGDEFLNFCTFAYKSEAKSNFSIFASTKNAEKFDEIIESVGISRIFRDFSKIAKNFYIVSQKNKISQKSPSFQSEKFLRKKISRKLKIAKIAIFVTKTPARVR